MSLGIIIVNYRTPKVTLDCLASVAAQIRDVKDARVVLVDNASGDDSISLFNQAIEANGWKDWLTLAQSETNRGFAGGNNFGIDILKNIQPDVMFILLLNSDTLLQPNVLRYSVENMTAQPNVGIFSCLLLNPDLSVQNTARKLPTPLRLAAYSFGLPWVFRRKCAWANLDDPGWDRKKLARDVDWVGGAFMLLRRQMLDRIGVMDERFFFYGEDTELCHRAWKHGWRVRYDPGASIIHLGSASSDPTRLPSKQKDALMWKARYLLERRCYGRLAELFIRAVDITSFGLRYLKLRIRGKKNTPEFETQRDVLALLLSWPAAGKG
jgi:GT2 family glycosyltransferase